MILFLVTSPCHCSRFAVRIIEPTRTFLVGIWTPSWQLLEWREPEGMQLGIGNTLKRRDTIKNVETLQRRRLIRTKSLFSSPRSSPVLSPLRFVFLLFPNSSSTHVSSLSLLICLIIFLFLSPLPLFYSMSIAASSSALSAASAAFPQSCMSPTKHNLVWERKLQSFRSYFENENANE